MIRKKYWWLGFLGLVGFLELPDVLRVFQGGAPAKALFGLLWFGWFYEFLPAKNKEDTRGE